MGYDNGGMDPNWKPDPPPERGTARWKDDMAIRQAMARFNGLPERSLVVALSPVDGIELGYLAVEHRKGSGHNYFRVDAIEVFPLQFPHKEKA